MPRWCGPLRGNMHTGPRRTLGGGGRGESPGASPGRGRGLRAGVVGARRQEDGPQVGALERRVPIAFPVRRGLERRVRFVSGGGCSGIRVPRLVVEHHTCSLCLSVVLCTTAQSESLCSLKSKWPRFFYGLSLLFICRYCRCLA